MRSSRFIRFTKVLLLGLGLSASLAAFAQYPNRPVTLIVP
jgi:hypothetical protein